MAADMITGEGSTGAFINQFGLTDFLSLSGLTASAIQQVMNAYTYSPNGVNVKRVQSETGNPIPQPNANVSKISKVQNNEISTDAVQANNANQQNYSPFRIGAEDAFIEFLSLFKMNGVTWLTPTSYGFDPATGQYLLTPNQNTTSLYSEQVGASDFMIKARNNDVYSRGYVVMNFRNSQYMGFFKTFNWTMDANKPYQWNFSFTFQVERTLSLAYFASGSPSQGTVTTRESIGNITGTNIPGGVSSGQ
jgi:hypothetical protein